MIKIVLIEVGDFHDECLYSQVLFLQRPDIEVTVFANKKLESRINTLSAYAEIVFLDLSSKLKKYQCWFSMWKKIIFGGYSKVIFNSAESNIYKFIQFPFPKRIELIGTLHNGQHLKDKPKQKYISKKLHKYFVLNEFIQKNIVSENLTNTKIASYYPIFYPEFKVQLQKPNDEIWVTIPGVISFDKRDYEVFKYWEVPKNVKLIFLGRANNEEALQFIERAKSYASYSQMVFFSAFIPNDVFYNYMQLSDFILPLIHPTNRLFENFLKYKVTGSYNLAFGFKIPLLIEQSFLEIEDFKENALFYNCKDSMALTKALGTTQKMIYKNPKWSFEFQKKKYLAFIFS